MNKKLIPFIPIIGALIVVFSPAKSSELGLDKLLIFIGSAVFQAVCFALMFASIAVSI